MKAGNDSPAPPFTSGRGGRGLDSRSLLQLVKPAVWLRPLRRGRRPPAGCEGIQATHLPTSQEVEVALGTAAGSDASCHGISRPLAVFLGPGQQWSDYPVL